MKKHLISYNNIFSGINKSSDPANKGEVFERLQTHMFYSDLIKTLFRVHLFNGMKLGLENALQLQRLLKFPDHAFQTIHVAGTNGKGSVAGKIAYALEHEGYRVGLYTSPHLSSFRERMQVNGLMISEKAVEQLLPPLFDLVKREEISATFFELTTFLAFLYFVQEKVDVAVIEAGLGGRLDATNVISPCLSIITSISLDHTEVLGRTCEAIAVEKGGVIKENIPVIMGPHVPLDCIQPMAVQKGSPCMQVKESSPLFEEENRAIARAALDHLTASFSLSSHAIEKGLERRLPCRFEILHGSPLVILDVAHNPDGFQHLFDMLAHHYPNKSLRLVFGLSKSKDVQGCLKLIAAQATHFHLVEAPNGRGASPRDLAAYLRQSGIDDVCLGIHCSIQEAIHQAKEEALKRGDILVVCGSFFIMGEARQALGFQEPCDPMDLNEKEHGRQVLP